jgi:hypothetical protein
MYQEGMLVYLLAPSAAALRMASKKLTMQYVGPLVITALPDTNHVILSTLEGQQLTGTFHVNRIKPAWIRTPNGPTNTINKLTGLFKAKVNNVTNGTKTQIAKTQITDDQGNTPPNAEGSCRMFPNSQPISTEPHSKLATQNANYAATTQLNDKAIAALQKAAYLAPGQYSITKTRYKCGQLQLCVAQDPARAVWITVDDHPILKDAIASVGDHGSARIVGSSRLFMHQILGMK